MKSKPILIILAVVFLAGIAYLLFINPATKVISSLDVTTNTTGTSGDTTTTTTTTQKPEDLYPSVSWPIGYYEKGYQVLYTQKYLNQYEGANLAEDATYGPLTASALTSYLKSTGQYNYTASEWLGFSYAEFYYVVHIKPHISKIKL